MEQVAPTLEALTAELHALRDELIDAVQPIEVRVVALASALDRLEAVADRPLPVPAEPRTPGSLAAEAGAGAALIAAAATAMARVEARLEAEFDAIQRELAEVRTLLAPVPAPPRRLLGLGPRRRTA
jgi:hypothetical protein